MFHRFIFSEFSGEKLISPKKGQVRTIFADESTQMFNQIHIIPQAAHLTWKSSGNLPPCPACAKMAKRPPSRIFGWSGSTCTADESMGVGR